MAAMMCGSSDSIGKETISVTLDATVLAAVDADAKAAGLDLSKMIEQALRNEHLRVALRNYTARTVSALNIDGYAEQVYKANRAAGLWSPPAILRPDATPTMTR